MGGWQSEGRGVADGSDSLTPAASCFAQRGACTGPSSLQEQRQINSSSFLRRWVGLELRGHLELHNASSSSSSSSSSWIVET